MSKSNPSQESITRNFATYIPSKTPLKTSQRLPLKDSQKIIPKKVLNTILVKNQIQMPKLLPRDSIYITLPLFKGQFSLSLPPTLPKER
ncbi:10503_t:CDS:1, partial [Gigaspora margarita]